jgi:hypothetical protein
MVSVRLMLKNVEILLSELADFRDVDDVVFISSELNLAMKALLLVDALAMVNYEGTASHIYPTHAVVTLHCMWCSNTSKYQQVCT